MTVYLTPETKEHFVKANGKTYKLVRGEDGLFRDEEGGIWAYAERAPGDDPEVRCGVGILSLPKSHPLTKACAPHDYKYSSPAYQLFYNRLDADKDMRRDIKIISKKKWYYFLGQGFFSAVRLFGQKFWDNKKTNN